MTGRTTVRLLTWYAACRDCAPGANVVMTFETMPERDTWRAEHRRLNRGHRVSAYTRVRPLDLRLRWVPAERDAIRNVICAVYGAEISHGRPPGSFELTTPHRETLRAAAVEASATFAIEDLSDDELAWIDWAITDEHLPF